MTSIFYVQTLMDSVRTTASSRFTTNFDFLLSVQEANNIMGRQVRKLTYFKSISSQQRGTLIKFSVCVEVTASVV